MYTLSRDRGERARWLWGAGWSSPCSQRPRSFSDGKKASVGSRTGMFLDLCRGPGSCGASLAGGMEVSVRSAGISCCQSRWMSVRRGQRWPWAQQPRACPARGALPRTPVRNGALDHHLIWQPVWSRGAGHGHQNPALLSHRSTHPQRSPSRGCVPSSTWKTSDVSPSQSRGSGQNLGLRLTAGAERLRAAAGRHERGCARGCSRTRAALSQHTGAAGKSTQKIAKYPFVIVTYFCDAICICLF